jgi:heptosyltransferase-2
VRGVNWLGDAVMTTPALQRLREALPDAHLTLLTHEKLADLWHRHPSVDAVITFSPSESPWSVARRLRAESFQAAVVLPNSLRSALEVWLARIPQRIGFTRPCWSWLLTRAIHPRPGKSRMSRRSVSEVRRLISLPEGAPSSTSPRAQDRSAHQLHDYLHLVAALGANPEPLPPKLEISAAEMREAEEALAKTVQEVGQVPRLPSGPLAPQSNSGEAPKAAGGTPAPLPVLLGLNPGAEYGPAKRWPAERFAAVAREVCRKHGNCVWLAFGGASDSQLCSEIARLAGGSVVNLAGKTSLRQLMASLKLCRVLLTNDTGPMHVAAALGTPVVVPFGSTSPGLTGPGLPGDPRHQLLQAAAPCSPCFRRVCPIDFRCMTGISPARVVEAVSQALARG